MSRGEGEVVGFDPRPEVLLQRAWDRQDAPAQVLDTGQVDVDPRHREAGRGGRTGHGDADEALSEDADRCPSAENATPEQGSVLHSTLLE